MFVHCRVSSQRWNAVSVEIIIDAGDGEFIRKVARSRTRNLIFTVATELVASKCRIQSSLSGIICSASRLFSLLQFLGDVPEPQKFNLTEFMTIALIRAASCPRYVFLSIFVLFWNASNCCQEENAAAADDNRDIRFFEFELLIGGS